MTRSQFCRRALALAAVVGATFAAVPTGVPGSPAAAQAVVGDCIPGSDWGTPRQDLTARVIELVNLHRASLGLTQLIVTTPVSNAAIWKARHMAKYLYMTHDDPAPPVARTTAQRLEACGITSGWGENIAYGYATADAVMQGWLNSAGHRANIERSTYRAIGVGAASGSNGRIYWAQVFSTSTSGGSTPPPSYACSNGNDDDGDGKIDYPSDPGCASSTDNDEFNAAPPPPPPPPGALTAFPSTLTVNTGTPLAGGPASLAADDGTYFKVSSLSGSTMWWGRINGVPNTLTSLSVTYRGLSTTPCTQTLSIWNWQTGVWSSLGSRTLGTTEAETVATVTGTLANYVSGTTGNGDVAVRVACTGGYFTSFTTSSELLKIAYS